MGVGECLPFLVLLSHKTKASEYFGPQIKPYVFGSHMAMVSLRSTIELVS
jgi:hypothetical protein